MHLREVVGVISHADDVSCIVAMRPWGPESEAKLVRLTDDFRVPADQLQQGYEYFLEVSVAFDKVLDGLEDVLSPEQRFEAVLFYAENDAYPDWLCALRDQANEA